jgi:thiosulfate reductase cytochrome b subunit
MKMLRGSVTVEGSRQRARQRANRFARAWRLVERSAALLLLPLMVLQFLSGYAMLHWRIFGGILGRSTAFWIHSTIQPLTVAAIVVHGGAAIRRALRRRGIRSRWVNAASALVGAGAVVFSIYLRVLG